MGAHVQKPCKLEELGVEVSNEHWSTSEGCNVVQHCCHCCIIVRMVAREDHMRRVARGAAWKPHLVCPSKSETLCTEIVQLARGDHFCVVRGNEDVTQCRPTRLQCC